MPPVHGDGNPYAVDIFGLAKDVDDAVHRYPSDAELQTLLRDMTASLFAYVELRSVMMSTFLGQRQVRRAEQDIAEYTNQAHFRA